MTSSRVTSRDVMTSQWRHDDVIHPHRRTMGPLGAPYILLTEAKLIKLERRPYSITAAKLPEFGLVLCVFWSDWRSKCLIGSSGAALCIILEKATLLLAYFSGLMLHGIIGIRLAYLSNVFEALSEMWLYGCWIFSLGQDFEQLIIWQEVESWEWVPLRFQVLAETFLHLF